MLQMAFLRLKQDVQTRRKLEVCEYNLQPFWMAWDDQCESEHGVRRRVWAAGASRLGANGVLAALAQGSTELSVVSRCAASSPAVHSAQDILGPVVTQSWALVVEVWQMR